MAQLKDFLNPKSMLTPGIAGGLAVSISMPLVTAFNLKYPWVLLAISFLFSLSVVISFREKVPLRCVYCVLNTLVIFSVSFGAGKTIDPPPTPPKLPSGIEGLSKETTDTSRHGNIWNLGPSAAFAQGEKSGQGANSSDNKSTSGQQKKSGPSKDGAAKPTSDKQKQELDKYLRDLKRYDESQKKYDGKWSW